MMPLTKPLGTANMGQAFYRESIELAADITGGYDKLAEELGLAQHEVLSWLDDSRVPTSVFLRIVDIVLRSDVVLTGPNKI